MLVSIDKPNIDFRHAKNYIILIKLISAEIEPNLSLTTKINIL